jgi:hypothetical protein
MTVWRVKMATVEVKDYAALLEAWRTYRDSWVVGRYVVADRLRTPQLNRLPKALKRMLIHGNAASQYHCEQKDMDELERLFRLEDPRR